MVVVETAMVSSSMESKLIIQEITSISRIVMEKIITAKGEEEATNNREEEPIIIKVTTINHHSPMKTKSTNRFCLH